MYPYGTFLLGFAVFSGVGGAVVLLFQFLSVRMKNSGLPPEDRDPHLGRKFALSVFLHASILLLLAGLTVSMVDIMDNAVGGPGGGNTPATWRAGPGMPPPPPPAKAPFFNSQQRIACGLMLSGVIHGTLFAMLVYFGTNARKVHTVARVFVINRLLTAGVIIMTITTTFCLMLFNEGDLPLESFGRILGVAVVWGPTALGHLLWLMLAMKKDKPKQETRERDDDRRDTRRRRDDDD